MPRRLIVLAAGAVALASASGSTAARGPSVAQIKATIATHSDNFVLANSYGDGRHAPGHGWIDVRTGAGRWVSGNGKLVTLVSVMPDRRDPARVVVADTNINYTARTWSRTKREEAAKSARPTIVDPLAEPGVQFRLLGIESVKGRQTYHLRSTYSPHSENETARLDVWFSTDQDYLIRFTRTTRDGKVIQRVDNHWLSRTAANLALVTTVIPSGFREVFVSS